MPSVRAAMGPISAAFYGRPAERLRMVGVTGTNGKTTTTFLLESVFRAAGWAPGVIGTTGVGLHTGVAVVGNIGAQGKKMDYTMIGDYVNLTARVEGLTRHFSTGIVLTEYTAVRVKALIVHEESADNRGCLGHVALHKLGAVKVKGKETVVVVYGLTSLERHERSSVNESSSEGIVEVSE